MSPITRERPHDLLTTRRPRRVPVEHRAHSASAPRLIAPRIDPTRPGPAGLPLGSRWQGRALRFGAAPAIDTMPLFADLGAEVLRRTDGHTVTWSLDDLATIDRIVLWWREQGLGSNDMAETLWYFGALAGSVLVRTAQAEWIETPEQVMPLFGMPLAIALPAGNIANPLGKAIKLLDNGPADSLHAFATSLTALD